MVGSLRIVQIELINKLVWFGLNLKRMIKPNFFFKLKIIFS
jgi:hypothetical protein